MDKNSRIRNYMWFVNDVEQGFMEYWNYHQSYLKQRWQIVSWKDLIALDITEITSWNILLYILISTFINVVSNSTEEVGWKKIWVPVFKVC